MVTEPSHDRRRPAAGTLTRLDAALASARQEVMALCTSTGPLRAARSVDRGSLRPGVRCRVLLQADKGSGDWSEARLAELVHVGAQVRVAPRVPLDALVIDRAVAIFPGGGSTGVATATAPGIVTTAVELFEQMWPHHAPLTVVGAPDRPAPNSQERELLHMLSAGWGDESIAAQLGVSVRTVRRRISTIMNRIGARSRFQAGVIAASAGWVRPRRPDRAR
ncbi:helix-turn-helix transcriptional regulator [Allonocardiopsis opalescens]|uniref:Regulatory LuxR family protein n=1 Tax=Allonocardiopsis opalescens TaxID=1144618 RepID=A0A2T0PYF0_9ACTN|nr:helix-turn-helix transcriptional regulator [Allonocardiopsis opalescens]PRX96566.1 regulatory LuxR family protein [Allonocardiopsis opalescens]